MNQTEKSLEDAIAYLDDILQNPDRPLKLEPHERTPVSLQYLKSICKSIGCSMVDQKCPGNPNCSIIRRILR